MDFGVWNQSQSPQCMRVRAQVCTMCVSVSLALSLPLPPSLCGSSLSLWE